MEENRTQNQDSMKTVKHIPTYEDFTPAEIRRQIIWLLEQIDDMEALKRIDALVNRLHWDL